MLHPIYLALMRRPDLAADHLLAYAELIRLQTQVLRRAVVGRSLAWLLTLVCAVLSVFFAGTGLMLSLLLDRYHPVQVLLPGALALSALAGLLLARRRLPAQAYAQLREQMEQDLAALRSLSVKP